MKRWFSSAWLQALLCTRSLCRGTAVNSRQLTDSHRDINDYLDRIQKKISIDLRVFITNQHIIWCTLPVALEKFLVID